MIDKSVYVAMTGASATLKAQASVSHNLANANTVGFQATLNGTVAAPVQGPGLASRIAGLLDGTGVRVAATAKQFTQGNLSQTGNALDVAINGRGFFEVLLPDGSSAYTRDGSFQINAQGEMVTNAGYPVQPGLQLPEGAQSITIGADGTVSVQLAGEPEAVQVGALTLADFVNPAGLQAKGENLYIETGASGPAQQGAPGTAGAGLLVQGALESSNVNVVEELVSMIETQRAYETNAKAISTTDNMLGFLNQNL